MNLNINLNNEVNVVGVRIGNPNGSVARSKFFIELYFTFNGYN